MRISDWSSDVCSSDLEPDRDNPRTGCRLDDSGRDAPARVPEYLRYNGRDRHVQAQGARFDEDDGRYAVDRGREVARLYRARRGRGAECGRVGQRAVQARGAVSMSEVDEQHARPNELLKRTPARYRRLSHRPRRRKKTTQ